jgi:segregation and condensation protein A
LDLLLFLIRRAEVDINDIPIVSITGQYFELLREIDEIDIEIAGEFLVMAATLIEIKSRSLKPIERTDDDAPEDIGDDGAGSDPRFELVQQLMAYQRYRAASERLDEHRFEHSKQFAAVVRPSDVDPVEDEEPEALEIEDAHLGDLIDAYQRIVEAVDFGKMGDHEIEYDDTPIALHEQDLVDRMMHREDKRLSLVEAMTGKRRVEMIGLFLAVLELARNQRVRVFQTEDKDDIILEFRPEEDREELSDVPANGESLAEDQDA